MTPFSIIFINGSIINLYAVVFHIINTNYNIFNNQFFNTILQKNFVIEIYIF